MEVVNQDLAEAVVLRALPRVVEKQESLGLPQLVAQKQAQLSVELRIGRALPQALA